MTYTLKDRIFSLIPCISLPKVIRGQTWVKSSNQGQTGQISRDHQRSYLGQTRPIGVKSAQSNQPGRPLFFQDLAIFTKCFAEI